LKTLRTAVWLTNTPREVRDLTGTFKRARWDLEVAASSDDVLMRLNLDDPEVDFLIVEPGAESVHCLQRARTMDPDLPCVLLRGAACDPALLFEVGRCRRGYALDIKEPVVGEDNLRLLLGYMKGLPPTGFPPSYDRKQRQLANRVASSYDQFESEKPGTVAFWLHEERMITELIQELKSRATDPLRILEMGCGTGRLVKCALDADPSCRVRGVDFSGRMITEAKQRLESYGRRWHGERGVAEQLNHRVHKNYDLVIMGFGFPCYAPTDAVLKEARRVLRPDGHLWCSAYNHNALAYERWQANIADAEPERPISTWIDRERGELWIREQAESQPSTLPARTFTLGHFERHLRHAGFQVIGCGTFPVLYSLLGRSEISKYAEGDGRERCYGNADFSFRLYELDELVSQHLRDKGYYSYFLASKTTLHVEALRQRMGLFTPKVLEP